MLHTIPTQAVPEIVKSSTAIPCLFLRSRQCLFEMFLANQWIRNQGVLRRLRQGMGGPPPRIRSGLLLKDHGHDRGKSSGVRSTCTHRRIRRSSKFCSTWLIACNIRQTQPVAGLKTGIHRDALRKRAPSLPGLPVHASSIMYRTVSDHQ